MFHFSRFSRDFGNPILSTFRQFENTKLVFIPTRRKCLRYCLMSCRMFLSLSSRSSARISGAFSLMSNLSASDTSSLSFRIPASFFCCEIRRYCDWCNFCTCGINIEIKMCTRKDNRSFSKVILYPVTWFLYVVHDLKSILMPHSI